MNTPSPLVPQGSIQPRNTSRSGRVLLIALTVVICHVGGLAVILMQGCKNDALKTAGTGDTNTPALTLPTIDTNPPTPYYTAASNLPPVSVATPAPTVVVNTPTVSTGAPSTPSPTAGTPPAGVGVEPPTSVGAAATGSTDYKVNRGDTLSAIAKKHKVTIGAIQAANGNLDPKRLMPGQTIKIPAPSPAAPISVATSVPPDAVPAATGTSYTIKPGDNLIRIAKAHGVTVNQLMAANNLRTRNIQAGKTLKIPARTSAAAPAGSVAQ